MYYNYTVIFPSNRFCLSEDLAFNCVTCALSGFVILYTFWGKKNVLRRKYVLG